MATKKIIVEVEIEGRGDVAGKVISSKTHRIFGLLKNWKIDAQELKDELRKTHGDE